MPFFQQPFLAALADRLCDIVFPPKCAICNDFYRRSRRLDLNRTENGFADDVSSEDFEATPTDTDPGVEIRRRILSPYWCEKCINGYHAVHSPLCICCGMMFKSREGPDHLCGDCIQRPKYFKSARAAGIYGESLMTAIYRFKYHGKIRLAKPLGLVLFYAFRQYWPLDLFDLILPVPLHPKRFKNRGFNQSYLLVRDWNRNAARWNVNPPHHAIDRDLLIRLRPTVSQTGLSRKDRIRNIKNAFGLKASTRVERQSVLLVDDVYTTGSTVDECSRVLHKAGAKRVDVLTLARSI